MYLINNAGVGITGPLEEIPLEEIKNNFETNVFRSNRNHESSFTSNASSKKQV